jgi:sugar phosphate isomerase/epimerase
MKPAFSTVACPDWTLDQVAEHAEKWGFQGCELRTTGYGATEFACDPALTSAAKVRGMLGRAGVQLVSLGTSIRFDEPIDPPLLGHVFGDNDRSVREAKGAINLAVQLECPFVRVFGFELPEGERRANGVARIVDRLRKSVDAARNSGVTFLLENGGSFPRAADLAEIIDGVNHPLLAAAYNAPVAMAAGESIADGANVLGDRLAVVKVRDFKDGKPCALGDGQIDNRGAVGALARAGFSGWLVYEFDRAWFGHGKTAGLNIDDVMTTSARRMFEWVSTPARAAAGV